MRYAAVFICISILLTASPGLIDGDPSADMPDLSTDTPKRSENASNSTGLYNGLITYEDTALIVNDNSEISREIGTYFAQRRGLPSSNIINITAPTDEIIDFDEFDSMMEDISDTLESRDLTDSIDYLVTTKGVPLKITSGYYNMNDQRYYYSASVDSELMLMDSSKESAIHDLWWIDNPYYDADNEAEENNEPNAPFSREDYDGIRLVTRLTGYTVEEAKRLVDLAEPSLGVRGEAYLDMDPRKGMGNSGYGVGNKWMNDANDWFVDNGHPAHLDNTNTFQTDMTNVSAYFSWGSNDGDWGENQMTNTGFEAGSGIVPTGWILQEEGGMIERTTERSSSGSWSLKLTRNSTGRLRAYQDVPVSYPDHRYIADARIRLEGVTSPGARILIEGYDTSDDMIWSHTLANRTGTRNWFSVQDPLENETGTDSIRYVVELLGEGEVFFDQTYMRVIRPHNQWVPGAIAETIVSTGGRSQTYGTWYGQSLIADLIRDGVTGIKGYAWEPFIGAISHADILFPAYYSGYSLAESFWMGSEISSWMGYVVGDPKCTPYLNERADMGFDPERPISTFVDGQGIPHISITLYNKGKQDVVDGSVNLYIDGVHVWDDEVSIGSFNETTINISSEDEPIIGEHRFKVVLNDNEKIWEYDQGNNILDVNMTVNSIPELAVAPDSSEVGRTQDLNITAYITDGDPDIDIDLLEMEVTGPRGGIYTPEVINSKPMRGEVEVDLRFTPPWNATTGFYTVKGTYTDPQGSFASDVSYSSFKVVNTAPEINGSVEPSSTERGGVFEVDLSWSDPDTPDGDLDIDIFASRVSGGRIEPVSSTNTSDHSRSYMFKTPVETPSGTWTVSALATDRDGSEASWESTAGTFNLPPEIKVEGIGRRLTRSQDMEFTVQYIDPEGLDSGSISLTVWGPLEEANGETILERDLSLESGEYDTITIESRNLPVGSFGLRIDFQDDERLGNTTMIEPLFTIVPVPPVISEPVIEYDEGDGPPGGSFTRGESVDVKVPVNDPDSIVGDITVEALLIMPDGKTRELFPETRGDGIYRMDIDTDGSWDGGYYSLNMTITDEDGLTEYLTTERLFRLDAEFPVFEEASLMVYLNGTAHADLSVGIFPSSSQPDTITLFLYDGNETMVGEIELMASGGFGSFEGHGTVEGTPVRGAFSVTDDLGRSFWFNDTMDIELEIQDITPEREKPSNGDEDDSTLLLLGIISGLLILTMVLVSMVVLVLKKKSDLKAAPPMAAPIPQTESPSVPPASTPSGLPAAKGEGTGSVPERELPPGRMLDDGGTYHKPEQAAQGQESIKPDVTPPHDVPGAPEPIQPEKPHQGGPGNI